MSREREIKEEVTEMRKKGRTEYRRHGETKWEENI
jgi:hypothetical protein